MALISGDNTGIASFALSKIGPLPANIMIPASLALGADVKISVYPCDARGSEWHPLVPFLHLRPLPVPSGAFSACPG